MSDDKQLKKVFDGVLYDVFQWEQEEFDGSIKTYEKIVRKTTLVKMLAIDKGKVLLLEEEQPHWGKKGLVLPAGKVDIGEEPIAAAKRELAEETGLVFDKLSLVDSITGSGSVEFSIDVFVATGILSRQEKQLEPGESNQVMWVGFREFISLVREHKLRYPTEIIERFLVESGEDTAYDFLENPSKYSLDHSK